MFSYKDDIMTLSELLKFYGHVQESKQDALGKEGMFVLPFKVPFFSFFNLDGSFVERTQAIHLFSWQSQIIQGGEMLTAIAKSPRG